MNTSRTCPKILNRILTVIGPATPFVLLLTATLLSYPSVSAAPQMIQSCVEDFSLDSDPSMPGFASSVFVHSPSGIFCVC